MCFEVTPFSSGLPDLHMASPLNSLTLWLCWSKEELIKGNLCGCWLDSTIECFPWMSFLGFFLCYIHVCQAPVWAYYLILDLSFIKYNTQCQCSSSQSLVNKWFISLTVHGRRQSPVFYFQVSIIFYFLTAAGEGAHTVI